MIRSKQPRFLEGFLLAPTAGDLIEGTGGARKLRFQLNDNRGYRNDTGRLARIRLIVNSTDWSLVNLVTPDLTTPTADGDAVFTLPLKPGRTNTVDLVAFDGAAEILALTTEPLD